MSDIAGDLGQRMTSSAPTTKTQWAYEAVRSLILDGELAPDAAIDQQALAASLGISTTPLREALRRLEVEDFVIGREHKDMRVAPLLVGDLEHIYTVRLELDPLAAKLAAQHATDGHIAATEKLLPREGLSGLAALRANHDFHRAIYAASGNGVLTKILDGLFVRCDRYRASILASPGRAAAASDEHREMYELFLRRDGDALAALMRRHLEGSLRNCRTLVAELRPA